eukprot:2177226-Amphidinium_carterae.3
MGDSIPSQHGMFNHVPRSRVEKSEEVLSTVRRCDKELLRGCPPTHCIVEEKFGWAVRPVSPCQASRSEMPPPDEEI